MLGGTPSDTETSYRNYNEKYQVVKATDEMIQNIWDENKRMTYYISVNLHETFRL